MRAKVKQLLQHFSGRDVFIIGGGTSANQFDFSTISPLKRIVVLNSSLEIAPRMDMIYWTDSTWAATHLPQTLIKDDNIFKVQGKFNCVHAVRADRMAYGNAIPFNITGSFGMDPDIDCLRGNNSGAQAIHLMANLRVSSIHLIGYDMAHKGNKSHCHTKYSNSRIDHYPDFIKSISSMQEHLTRLGIPVVNYNKKSNLKCFPFVDNEEGL